MSIATCYNLGSFSGKSFIDEYYNYTAVINI